MSVTAAADGFALHSSGPAGWCQYIDGSRRAAGGWKEGTNNREEFTALVGLLRATTHILDEPFFTLCDLQYVINSITRRMSGQKRKGWKKCDGKSVLNVDILQGIDQPLVSRNIHLEQVEGHSGHDMNEAADQRAHVATTVYQKDTAAPEGPGFDGAGSRIQTSSSYPKSAPTAIATPASDSRTSRTVASEQEGLSDLAVDTTMTSEDAAGTTLIAFRRAAHRVEQNNARALKALLNDTLGASLAVLDGLSDAEHELHTEGTAATAQFTTDD